MNTPTNAPTRAATVAATTTRAAGQGGFPDRLRWSAQQLADAVPLRLFELLALAVEAPADAANAGRHASPRAARAWHGRYASRSALPCLIRVHG